MLDNFIILFGMFAKTFPVMLQTDTIPPRLNWDPGMEEPFADALQICFEREQVCNTMLGLQCAIEHPVDIHVHEMGKELIQRQENRAPLRSAISVFPAVINAWVLPRACHLCAKS